MKIFRLLAEQPFIRRELLLRPHYGYRYFVGAKARAHDLGQGQIIPII